MGVNSAKNDTIQTSQNQAGMPNKIIKKTLIEYFGASATDSILRTGSENFGITVKEILSSYNLFSQMIEQVYGEEGRKQILYMVERNIK